MGFGSLQLLLPMPIAGVGLPPVILQVRVYQFSATPKHIECVVFESVGGRDNNHGLGIKVCVASRVRITISMIQAQWELGPYHNAHILTAVCKASCHCAQPIECLFAVCALAQ